MMQLLIEYVYHGFQSIDHHHHYQDVEFSASEREARDGRGHEAKKGEKSLGESRAGQLPRRPARQSGHVQKGAQSLPKRRHQQRQRRIFNSIFIQTEASKVAHFRVLQTALQEEFLVSGRRRGRFEAGSAQLHLGRGSGVQQTAAQIVQSVRIRGRLQLQRLRSPLLLHSVPGNTS